MVLPLYAALERLDPSLLEAAWDLYARPHQVFVRVVLPLSKPGVIAGCVLVFIPSLGAYVTPDLLGGARSMMIGNLIQHQYLVVRDWPFGSALSFVLMAGVLAAGLFYLPAGGAGGPWLKSDPWWSRRAAPPRRFSTCRSRSCLCFRLTR